MSTTKASLLGHGEEKENAFIRKQEMRFCGLRSAKKRDTLAAGDILVEVEHVKAQRTQEDKKEVSHFEKFVTEGNEKADELAKGALWGEGFMAEVRAKTVQQERRSVRSLALFH